MMDWHKVNLEEFVFDVDVEAIQQIGTSQVFPVQVQTRDGIQAFTFNIPVRTEFYRQLRQTADWEPTLIKILKARVRDEILKRKQQTPVVIEDKLKLIGKQISLTE